MDLDLENEVKKLRQRSPFRTMPVIIAGACTILGLLVAALSFFLWTKPTEKELPYILAITVLLIGLPTCGLFFRSASAFIKRGTVVRANILSVSRRAKMGWVPVSIRYQLDQHEYESVVAMPAIYAGAVEGAGHMLVVVQSSKPKRATPLHAFASSPKHAIEIASGNSGL